MTQRSSIYSTGQRAPDRQDHQRHPRHRETDVEGTPHAVTEQPAAHRADAGAGMSVAALLMQREPVHGRVCFGQPSQRLLDVLSRGVSALDVPDHLPRQSREPGGAIYIAVSRSFKVEGREPHGRQSNCLAVEFANPPLVPLSDLTLAKSWPEGRDE
ncbi:hypothetical protein NKI54_03635 [Mesorhizobium sp. M0663]|uniref:hypothetical protein n=1 Tax=Mesorhizobium sp. M0663 TaxID=2956981 RepID=UPI003335B2A5